jgi:hypothetical protein
MVGSSGSNDAPSVTAKSGARSTPAARKSATTRTRGASAPARATGSRRPAATRLERTPAHLVGEYAERALLIQIGAVLSARDSVAEVFESYGKPSAAQTQLKKFERRGSSARQGLEREMHRARTRVEHELDQRRRRIERAGSGLATRVQERVLSLI